MSGCIKDEDNPTFDGSSKNDDHSSDNSPKPNDPLVSYAWHLANTGQTSFSDSAGISGEDINVAKVHAQGIFGKGIRIAISDSGTETTHPDLKDNELIGEHRNYFNSDSGLWHGQDPIPADGDAHGTAVTGLISAVGWNNLGSRGIAPKSKFAGFYFIMEYPLTATLDSLLARLVDQMDGDFDIFNYSYGSDSCSFEAELEIEHSSLLNGVTNLRDSKGAIYVQSSGNKFIFDDPSCVGSYDNTNRDPSLASPYKIIVGAVNANGEKSSYSTPGSGIWVSSPGGEFGDESPAIVTTDTSGCFFGLSKIVIGSTHFNDGYHPLNSGCHFTSIMNGTSSAAPILSGVVALMLEANPELTWRDVKHILALSSDKIDVSGSNNLTHPEDLDLTSSSYIYDKKWITNNAGFHFSNWYGFGRVNALEAVQLAQSYEFPLGEYEQTMNPNTEEWYYSSGDLSMSIPDESDTGVSSTIEVSHNFIVEAVQIRLTTNHSHPGDLAVHLISPRGTESRLLNLNSRFDNAGLDEDFLMLSNAFYGEESYGIWRIKIFDGSSTETGSLSNWKINIHGSRKSANGLTPNMPQDFTYTTPFPSITSSPEFEFTHSTSPNIIRYEVSIGRTPGANDVLDWSSIGYVNNFQVTGLTLGNLQLYHLNIRAIDVNENKSLTFTTAWNVAF